MPKEAPVQRRRGRPKTKDFDDVGRRGLIEAGKRIFASSDIQKINRRIFAERAGVDPNLVRYYFGDMRSLMAEVISANHNRARNQMLQQKIDHSPEERLRYRVRRTFQIFRDQPNQHQMVRMALYDTPESDYHRDWVALLQDAVEDLEDILKEGVSCEQMRSGVDAASLHLVIIAACEFWATNGPVVNILFAPKKAGKALDDSFVEFLENLIVRALRSCNDDGPGELETEI